MIDVGQLVIYGVVLGAIFTLGAIGVSMIFGILGFANFAHGDMMTLGAYLALLLVVTLHVPMIVAFPLALVGTAAAVIAIDQTIFRPLRKTQPVILLISSFGIGLMLRSLIQMLWGPQSQVYWGGVEFPLRFAGLRIQVDHIWIFGGAVGLVTLVHLFLKYTRMGKAMRAMADNADLARTTGIDTERVIIWTWAIGAALAAAAGIFLGIDTRLQPVMGWDLLLPVFAAAILGGIGRPYGAIVGGMTIGIAEEVSTMFIEPTYKSAVAFTIMVLMLLFRPRGLFAGK